MCCTLRDLAFFGLLLLISAPAFAAFDADFFSRVGAPSSSYDAARSAWTIGNRGIQRGIRFDSRSGGLVPDGLRHTRSKDAAGAEAVSEGEIAMVATDGAPAPIPLDWRWTNADPGEDWSRPDADAGSWRAVALPFRTDEEHRSWWFLADVPGDAVGAGRNLELTLDHSVDDAAEVFADGRRIAEITAEGQPWNHIVTVTVPAASRRIGILLKGGGRPNGLANAGLAAAPRVRPLRLDHGWALRGHAFENGALSIRLQGKGENEGFDATIVYLARAGEEPVLYKRVFLRNKTGAPWRLSSVVLDRLRVKADRVNAGRYTGSGVAVSSGSRGPGIAAAVFSWQGQCDLSDGGREVVCRYAPNAVVASGEVARTPWAVAGLYDGPPETGAFLLQLTAGAHVSRATPRTVPPLFSTWFGYYMNVDETLVRQLIPMAADLGVKVFSIDDGWQALDGGTVWGYGDWEEDRVKFPNGLAPIAEMAREHEMAFGLWSAPIMVADDSGVIRAHPEWLVRQADGSRKALWNKTSAMCFSGEYAKRYTEELARKARALKLGFVKLDGSLFVEGCTAEGHGHPAGYSEAVQVEAWERLASALREASPGIIVDRGWEGEPGLTAVQDTGWFGDWSTAFHPEREADPRWWYRNADIYRRALYTLAANRPPYTLSWETPCHIPTDPPDLNALEYHFTSIGAYICNVEIHGRLMESTPEERALIRKWVQWNADNREWLAFSQPIAALGKPYDALDEASVPHPDGVMHLRNALRGRYGYVCLWNPSGEAEAVSVAIRPADYFVRMNIPAAMATSIRDGQPVEARKTADDLTLRVPMPPRSWQIIEIRDASA